jgi:hypothetical protein
MFYELDSSIMQHGYTVVLLLPYHCHYSPFELISAQAKSCFADMNNTFRIADVEQLTHEAVDKIQTSAWNDCVQHVEGL